MDFQNLVKAMIKPLKWEESPRHIDAYFSEDYSVFKDADDGVVYLEIHDQEEQIPYPSLAKAKEAADEHNRARLMAALAEVMDFDLEQAFKQTYPDATVTLNAEGWWEVRKTPNSMPFAYGKTHFEALCKALAI